MPQNFICILLFVVLSHLEITHSAKHVDVVFLASLGTYYVAHVHYNIMAMNHIVLTVALPCTETEPEEPKSSQNCLISTIYSTIINSSTFFINEQLNVNYTQGNTCNNITDIISQCSEYASTPNVHIDNNYTATSTDAYDHIFFSCTIIFTPNTNLSSYHTINETIYLSNDFGINNISTDDGNYNVSVEVTSISFQSIQSIEHTKPLTFEFLKNIISSNLSESDTKLQFGNNQLPLVVSNGYQGTVNFNDLVFTVGAANTNQNNQTNISYSNANNTGGSDFAQNILSGLFTFDNSNVQIKSCIFEDFASIPSSLFQIQNNSTLEIVNSHFTQNIFDSIENNVIYCSNYSTILLMSTIIDSNEFNSGATFINANNQCLIEAKNTTFTNTNGGFSGGGDATGNLILLQDSCTFSCIKCEFYNNYFNSWTDGGAIVVTRYSFANIVDSTIFYHTANFGSLFYSHTFSSVSIINSTLEGNYAFYGSIIYGFDNSILIQNSYFNTYGWLNYYGGLFYIGYSTLTVINSQMFDTSSYYGGAVFSVNSDVVLEDTECSFMYSYDYGGCINHESDFGINTSVVFRNSIFSNNVAGLFSGVIDTVQYDGSKLDFTINNCTFDANNAAVDGVLYAMNADLLVENSQFVDNQGNESAGAMGLLQGSARLINSTFIGNSANDVAGVIELGYTVDQDFKIALLIQDCVFKDNIVYYGCCGVILVGSIPDVYNGIVIENSQFINNTAGTAAGVYMYLPGDGAYQYPFSSHTSIIGNKFIDNRAHISGAVFWVSTDQNEADNAFWQSFYFEAKNNFYTGNMALEHGSVFYFHSTIFYENVIDVLRLMTDQRNNIYKSDNTDHYIVCQREAQRKKYISFENEQFIDNYGLLIYSSCGMFSCVIVLSIFAFLFFLWLAFQLINQN